MKLKAQKQITYEQKLLKCEEFIKNYEDYDIGDVGQAYEQYGRKKYLIDIVIITNIKAKNC